MTQDQSDLIIGTIFILVLTMVGIVIYNMIFHSNVTFLQGYGFTMILMNSYALMKAFKQKNNDSNSK